MKRTRWKFMLLAIGLIALMAVPKVFADDKKTDGEILGILMAGDKNEIAAAKQAQSKSIRGPVMDFAKMLETDHTNNLSDLESLSAKDNIKPAGGTALRAKGAAMMASLMVKDGIDYENSYLEDMIKDHTEDLDMIDNDLMKDVQNPDLKAQLSKTRDVVSKHLDKAKTLLSNNKAAAAKTP